MHLVASSLLVLRLSFQVVWLCAFRQVSGVSTPLSSFGEESKLEAFAVVALSLERHC